MSEKEIIEKMINEGKSNVKIAEVIGCHRTTIPKKINKYGIDDSFREIKKQKFKLEKKVGCVICDKPTDSKRRRCSVCDTNIRRYRARKAGVEYLGGECNRCDWSGDISGYDFHHLRDKKFNLNGLNMANKKWVLVKEELDKCELLCALCHRLEHSNYMNDMFIEIANDDNEELVFKN